MTLIYNATMTNEIVIPGNFVHVLGLGILITGKAGLGKSELTLGLISRNHQFIADDATCLTLKNNRLLGSNPTKQYLLSVRGLGLFAIASIYGPQSIKQHHFLDLIIHLDDKPLHTMTHLSGAIATRDILGCLIPCITIPIIQPRNLEILVETIARNYLLNINKDVTSVTECNEFLDQNMDTSLT